MVNRIVDLSLKHRPVVIGLAVAFAVWGWWAATATPIDAIPDLSDNQVIVFTDWPGHSAQEVEDQVSYPLTVNLRGLAGIRVVRSQSAFGFSMIYVVFEDNVDQYFARSRVLERLSLLGSQMPDGAVPVLGPDATGVGHVFWYTVDSDRHSLRDLRTLQDWFIRYQLNAVPGVAEVASVGGHVQQYQIDIDPTRLRNYNLTLGTVVEAVRNSNENVGGNVLESNGTWSIVRGVGLVQSVADLENIVIAAPGGVPVYVRQLGAVHIGDAFRVASLVKGSNEAVGGVVVMRTGANAQQVIDAVKERINQIAPGLPAGVKIVPFYDRSMLISQAADTLRRALLEEIVLVTLVQAIFLLHFRSILIVTLPLPLAVLISFLTMYYAGITSNIMSLAGIAIAIGVLVDAAIVVTENAFRQVEQQGVDTRDRGAVTRAVQASARLVGRPVFFSMAIIVLAFIPVFALTGQEGKLFHPLAFTKTFAVLAATIISITLVPVLCTLLIRGAVRGEDANPLMRGLRAIYQPCLEWALTHRAATLLVATIVLAGAVAVGTRIGSEFMPPLDEGDLLFMPVTDPSISLEQNTDIAKRQNAALMRVPEVEYAVAKVGRADTSTDPSPLNMTETIVHLKPRDQWRAGMTLDRLRNELGAAAQLPGVTNIWTMPIINRIDMLSTGIRSEVGVKIYGSDLPMLEQTARQVADVLRTVPGAANVYPEPLTSSQYLNVRVDRERAARYGLTVSAVQDVIRTAIGERNLMLTLEGRRRFPVRVRYASEYRSDPQALSGVLVASPAGQQIPLAQVADIEQTRGPAMISSENGLLLATVLMNVQGRDLGGFVNDAKAAVAARVTLPPGYFIGWSGRYENQVSARKRLQIVIPIAIIVIFFLLYFTYHSALEAAHVLLTVPFALTGGVYLLWLLGYNFSVAVWVGFIALFGTAVQTGVVMVIYLQEALDKKLGRLKPAPTVRGAGPARAREDGVRGAGPARAREDGVRGAGPARGREDSERGPARLTQRDLHDAIVEGALLRLRPKIMTVSTVVAGLLPIMWSNRVGADVMKPLATPVLGGMVSSLIYVLVVTPVLFYWIQEYRLRPERADIAPVIAIPRWVPAAILIVIAVGAGAWWMRDRMAAAPQTATEASTGTVLQTVRTSDLAITLSSPSGSLRTGENQFRIEFRSTRNNQLVDVGSVRLDANMMMPGMAMTGTTMVEKSDRAGVYQAAGRFAMSGAWDMTLAWDGPAGRGSAAFKGSVQ
jgi:Cu(I)/Ag(I) efflux system membrane protein CusA/SilA